MPYLWGMVVLRYKEEGVQAKDRKCPQTFDFIPNQGPNAKYATD